MTMPDITEFRAAATATKAIVERIDRARVDHETTWRMQWQNKHDRFYALAMAAPTDAGPAGRDAWMERNHPDACRDLEAAESAVAAYVSRRETDIEALVQQKRKALAALGSAYAGRVLAIALGEIPAENAQETIAAIMEEATAIRRQHLDAGRVDFENAGPFTRALLEPAAKELGIDLRHRHWPSETMSCLSRPSLFPVGL